MGILFERSSFYVVIISIVVAFIVYWYIKYLVSYWDRHGVKSFKPSFPFGNFNASLFLKKSIGETVADIHNATKEPFIGVYGALRPILVVRDTELIHRILIKDFQHFVDRGVHCDEDYDPLSAHLFAMTGQKWKKLRSKLTPAFTSGKLKAMFTTMVECGSSFQKHIDDLVKINETIEIREIAARHSTQLVASVAFGLDIDCFTDSKSKFREYGRKALEPDLRNGIVFVLNFLFPAALKYLRIRSIKREVENFMRSVVKQNLEYREKNHVVRKDFFQLLVQLRNTGSVQSDEQWQTEIKNDGLKTMTLNEVTAQAYIFFLAGYETSSGTLSYCLFELAKNPEIQRKVREEIDRVRKEHNGEINYDSVAQMKYLDCCIDGKWILANQYSIPNNYSILKNVTQFFRNSPKISYRPILESRMYERISNRNGCDH